MMGECDRLGVVASDQRVGRGTGGRYYLRFFFFVLLSFAVSCPVPFLIE